jgi:hypothetical protein
MQQQHQMHKALVATEFRCQTFCESLDLLNVLAVLT